MQFSSGSGKDGFYAKYDDLKVYVYVGEFPNANYANKAINNLGLYDANTVLRINPKDIYDMDTLTELEENFTALSAATVLKETSSQLYKAKKAKIDKLINSFSYFDIVNTETLERTQYEFYAYAEEDKIMVNLGTAPAMSVFRNYIMKYDLFNLEYNTDNIKYQITNIKLIENEKDKEEFLNSTKEYTFLNLEEIILDNKDKNIKNDTEEALQLVKKILNSQDIKDEAKKQFLIDLKKVIDSDKKSDKKKSVTK